MLLPIKYIKKYKEMEESLYIETESLFGQVSELKTRDI